MPSNIKVSSDIDTLLRKQTKEEAAAFLGLVDDKAVWGQITGTLSNQTDLQDALDLKMRFPLSYSIVSGSISLIDATDLSGFGSNLNITEMWLGSRVNTVSAGAFNGCTNLDTLSLNEGLEVINSTAFQSCPNIDIPSEFPSTLVSVFASAFRYSFTNSTNTILKLPENVYDYGNYAFANAKFTKLILGKGTVDLSNSMFRDPRVTFTFDKGENTILETIGDWCFHNNVVTDNIYDFSGTNLFQIGTHAFQDDSNLITVILPDNPYFTIGEYAFFGCGDLVNFTLPSSIIRIETNTFRYCSSLPSITIPAGVTLIDHGAFRDCTGLASITSLATVAPSLGTLKNAFINVGTSTITVPVGSTASYKAAGNGTTYGGLTIVEA